MQKKLLIENQLLTGLRDPLEAHGTCLRQTVGSTRLTLKQLQIRFNTSSGRFIRGSHAKQLIHPSGNCGKAQERAITEEQLSITLTDSSNPPEPSCCRKNNSFAIPALSRCIAEPALNSQPALSIPRPEEDKPSCSSKNPAARMTYVAVKMHEHLQYSSVKPVAHSFGIPAVPCSLAPGSNNTREQPGGEQSTKSRP